MEIDVIIDCVVIILIIIHLSYLIKVHHDDIKRDKINSKLINSHIDKLDEHINHIKEGNNED